MQFRHDVTEERPVDRMDRLRNLFDEFVTELPLRVPHLQAVEHGRFGGLGNVDILGHAAPRRLTEWANSF
jgi:hypothetical protein